MLNNSKDRLDASVELKKANARVQGLNYLSKEKFAFKFQIAISFYFKK